MRYPLSDLVAATGLSEAATARLVKLSGSTLKKAREIGFTADAADRYACRAGYHPMEVWSDYGAEGTTPCEAEDCDKRFAPTRVGHRFCSKACRNRINSRVRYRESEERRAQQIAYAARYYEEAGEYVRARVRARYHAAKVAA